MRKLTPLENSYLFCLTEKYPSRMDWNIDQKQAYRIGFTEGIDYQQERIKELEMACMTVIRDAMARPGAYLYADINILRSVLNEVTK